MPLPDETRAKSAKDLIARFQSSINTNVEPPLKPPRHSFGSNEVRPEGAGAGAGAGASPSSGGSNAVAAGTTGRQSLGVVGQPERSSPSTSPSPQVQPANADAQGVGSDPNTSDSQPSKLTEDGNGSYPLVEKGKNNVAKESAESDNNATPSKAVSTLNASKPKTPGSSSSTAAKHAKETSSTSTASSSKAASTARGSPKPTPTRSSPNKPQQSSPAVPAAASSTSNDLRKSVSHRAMTPTASSLAKSRAAGVVSPTVTGSPSSTASPNRREAGSPSPSTSRLMRPTASSATKARSSLGGPSAPSTPAKAEPTTPSRVKSSLSSAARPQSSASKRVSKSPVPPLPAGTSPRGTETLYPAGKGKEAASSSHSATPVSAGVRRSSAAQLGARETSRATPTKVRPPAPASTSAESPKAASVIERLSKPTVASANHARQASAPVSPQKTASPARSTAQAATGRSPAKAAGAASSPRALKLTPGKSTMRPVSKPKTAEEVMPLTEPESSDHKQEPTIEPNQADIPEIPSEALPDVQGVQEELEKTKLDDDDSAADQSQHVQTSSSGSEVPSLSATSTTQPSEAASAPAEESSAEPAPPLSDTAAPSAAEEQEKVFTGFGPGRPHGKIGLPTSSLGENAPVELKISPSAGEDFSSKWGTREGTSPGALVSPSAGSSRAVSPSGSNQGTAAGEATKKVPIWMRKGGEANATG